MPYIYTNTKPTMKTPSILPAPIEKQLADLETRHKRHQRMLFEHHEAKHDRREQHRARKFARSIPPNTIL
jgi:hypothetical protein